MDDDELYERCPSRGDGVVEWGQCKKLLGHPLPDPEDNIHEDEEGHRWRW